MLTRSEVVSILQAINGTPRIVATLLYGAGLRLMEGLRLRVKDVGFTTDQIVVREGKRAKDRVTMLPQAVGQDLSRHLELVRQQHERDLARGWGCVQLPDSLARKSPNAGREWPWQWAFPASRPYLVQHDGHWQRRRHHLHPSAVQRTFREAVLRARIQKPATPHTLRHSFATHLLEDGRACPGESRGNPHRPGASRPPRCPHNHDLRSRPEPRRPWRPQPGRRARAGRSATGSAQRMAFLSGSVIIRSPRSAHPGVTRCDSEL